MCKLVILYFAKASILTLVACILKNAFGELGSKTFSSNLQSSVMILLGN